MIVVGKRVRHPERHLSQTLMPTCGVDFNVGYSVRGDHAR